MTTSNTVTKTDLENIINAIFPATTDDMSQAQIDAFIASLNISGLNAVDYIVDQGTSGIWTYRRWNSGIAECWGYKSLTISSWSTWGNSPYWYFIASGAENYPTGLFTTVTSVYGQIISGGGDTISSIAVRPSDMSVTAPSIVAIRPTAGSAGSGYAYWRAIGTWK